MAHAEVAGSVLLNKRGQVRWGWAGAIDTAAQLARERGCGDVVDRLTDGDGPIGTVAAL